MGTLPQAAVCSGPGLVASVNMTSAMTASVASDLEKTDLIRILE